ncbi:hypothetical protein RA280_24530 [Cupriavidus sp. CV2]|uniref:hypothetical protein n=1 Tax=Cupriavidus ulmosensis TaxID=3065913 RepID=UPI00296B1269|nr:hypothetical protein [Cupriavidus sp. CV2]MDW3684860.1 hypothetical protein [Cupriavidus sp. CV2]
MTKERPIFFSGAMVRAILDGRKTQTRRVFKLPSWADWYVSGAMEGEKTGDIIPKDPRQRGWYNVEEMPCPYGQMFDRMWVRETHYAFGRWETRYSAKKGRDEWHFVDITTDSGREYQYPDSFAPVAYLPRGDITPSWWKRPAIFMPRKASRILLEIVSVRVERLNDCSEADAIAEGCPGGHGSVPDYPYNATPQEHYRWLWDSINSAGAWEANPWVWVVEFRRF